MVRMPKRSKNVNVVNGGEVSLIAELSYGETS